MKIKRIAALLSAAFFAPLLLCGQQLVNLPLVKGVEPQPLVAQAERLTEALKFIGSSLSAADEGKLKTLAHERYDEKVVKQLQEILDPYCIAMVHINPEARVKVTQGPARPVLVQNGWKSFLVKVHNEAGVTAALVPESKNALPVLHISSSGHHAKPENKLTHGQLASRFLELSMYHNRPLSANLSGLVLEYAVLQVYSRDAGTREAELGFNIGQGSQDIGFRNTINLLFKIGKPVKVIFDVKDDDGKPAMASFVISDGVERAVGGTGGQDFSNADYRVTRAISEYQMYPNHLRGIYPLPSRRVAATDEYPDFFFQPQVYRSSGEHVYLPPGNYTVNFTRGPEYVMQTKEIKVPDGKDSVNVSFTLKRWISLASKGWFSADHHVHAAGCSHYESPEQGVLPKDMWRQILGEDLNVGAVLTWGPGWYHQKQFFTGSNSELSTSKNIMRYDVEVSGFPSSHAGHIVLLNLTEDDYPGTTKVEEWPSWTLPLLKWAKSQGGITGYAHSGWGLEPISNTNDLPNYIVPKMDGIGANEYIVTVTHDAVDFYSSGDTPFQWEMNMWYHTLNSGFRTRISGETDFPCIFDERVGLARSYFKGNGTLNFSSYINAIKDGRSYTSDGKSHIVDFAINGVEPGEQNSELNLAGKSNVKVSANVAAWLPEQPGDYEKTIAARKEFEQPFWNIERARIGSSRKVRVELIVNGDVADVTEITADGKWNEVFFNYNVERSSWLALRVKYSSHTNPVFALVDKQPVLVKKSAEWCLKAVDQCWQKKRPAIRVEEQDEAEKAYDHARKVYSALQQK